MPRPATAAVSLLTGEREPVRLATTGNITLYGLQTIDGVLTEVGDRVLVKDQSAGAQNGIYTASAGEWYRASDARTARTMQKGTTVHVQQGTIASSHVYSFQTFEPVIGTDDIELAFVQSDDTLGAVNEAVEAAVATVTSVGGDIIDQAEAARDATLAALSSVVAPKAILALVESDVPGVDPQYYEVAYSGTDYNANSGGKYRKVPVEPSQPFDKVQNGNGTWYVRQGTIDGQIKGIKSAGAAAPVIFVGSDRIDGGTANDINGGTTGRTLLSSDNSRGAAQDDMLRRVRLNIVDAGDEAGSFRVKQMRRNGASYDVINQSSLVLVGSTIGQVDYELLPAVGPFEQGDFIGIYMSAGGWKINAPLLDETGDTLGIAYTTGDVGSGAVYDKTALAGYDAQFFGRTGTPVLSCFGDSLLAGHNGGASHHWYTQGERVGTNIGPSGERTSEPPYILSQVLPDLTYRNFAVGGYNWEQTRDMIASTLTTNYPKSKVVWLHCGINDIFQDRGWPIVQDNMYQCLNLLLEAGAEHILLDEILPWPEIEASAATIRQWNANYASWCARNGVTRVKMHDEMGVIRPSTGFYDDQKYGVLGDYHLTKDGVVAMASIFSRHLTSALAF